MGIDILNLLYLTIWYCLSSLPLQQLEYVDCIFFQIKDMIWENLLVDYYYSLFFSQWNCFSKSPVFIIYIARYQSSYFLRNVKNLKIAFFHSNCFSLILQISIAFPDDGAWKRFHKQLQHFPTVIFCIICIKGN